MAPSIQIVPTLGLGFRVKGLGFRGLKSVNSTYFGLFGAIGKQLDSVA